MKFKQKKKNLKLRKNFRNIEILKIILSFFLKYFSNYLFKIIIDKKQKGNAFQNKIINLCIFSGKSYSIIKEYKCSKIFFKMLGSKGLFFGLIKASW